MLTAGQVQKIIIAALKSELLILTVKSETAREMCRDITDYIKNLGAEGCLQNSSYVKNYDGIAFKGGYENIYIMSAEKWNFGKKPIFKGRVFITNKMITDVKYVSETPLPVAALWTERE